MPNKSLINSKEDFDSPIKRYEDPFFVPIEIHLPLLPFNSFSSEANQNLFNQAINHGSSRLS